MKETKACTPEYLSTDILDKEFVSTFKIIHGLQFILGSCRIEAKDQFVTSPTRYQKCYTIFCILIALLLNIALINFYIGNIRDPNLYYLSAISIWIGYGIFMCVITHVRFFNGQSNADFFIRMQKVDRIMGLDKIKGINMILKKINNTSLVLLLFAFCVVVIYGVAISGTSLVYMTFLGVAYGQLATIIELIYCSSLIIYFVVRLRFTNGIIKNHLTQNKNCTKPETYYSISNISLRKFAIQTHNFSMSDTHVYIKELFDLFSMFQKLYRFQLFIFCLKLILESLCTFGLVLFTIQKNAADVLDSYGLFACTTIDLFIAIFLGIRLQLFFGELKETKRLSIAVMAAYSTGQLREKARKMLKMAEETPPRLSIYDMYDMDAGIFLTVFGLITSLIVTLLQFALLLRGTGLATSIQDMNLNRPVYCYLYLSTPRSAPCSRDSNRRVQNLCSVNTKNDE